MAANCKTCGTDIREYMDGQSQQCANCWEVERRLRDYLQSEAGQEFVMTELLERGCICDRQDFYIIKDK